MGDRSKDWDSTQSKDNRLDPARDQIQLRGTPRKNDAPVDLTLRLGSTDKNSYLLTSEDLTIGVEEGITAFEGLFLSTEPPSDIADHYEFFVEADVDVVAGVGVRYFWSMGGSNGLLTTITTGEELGASWGIGCSQATLIQ